MFPYTKTAADLEKKEKEGISQPKFIHWREREKLRSKSCPIILERVANYRKVNCREEIRPAPFIDLEGTIVGSPLEFSWKECRDGDNKWDVLKEMKSMLKEMSIKCRGVNKRRRHMKKECERMWLTLGNRRVGTKKTLVLDLDNTLIQSFPSPLLMQNTQLESRCTLEGIIYILRPGLLQFLQHVRKHYEVVIYTFSIQPYADSILNDIEIQLGIQLFDYRLYRNSIYSKRRRNKKPLYCKRAFRDRNIKDVIIIDDQPEMWFWALDNLIPIIKFQGMHTDTALQGIQKYLAILKEVSDIPKFNSLLTTITH